MTPERPRRTLRRWAFAALALATVVLLLAAIWTSPANTTPERLAATAVVTCAVAGFVGMSL